MSRRFLAGWAVLLGGVFLCCSLVSLRATPVPIEDDKDPAAKETAGKDFFGMTRVWDIHLELSSKEYEAMQPAARGFNLPGAPPAPPAPKAGKDKRDSERNLFGTEFPWAQGQLTVDNQTYRNIGVRYAGDITYFVSSRGLKRPLKIAFDKLGEQQFHGLISLDFHAVPMDATKAREVLALSVFRRAGVPAPRTAFANVDLTVPGKHDKERLGLYVVVENVDKRFLRDRFGTEEGVLMSPFQVRSLDYFGDNWDRYKSQYRPHTEPTREEAQRIIAFAKLVNQAGDAVFQKEIGSYLDIDAFLRFLAANTLTSNLQSAFALGHNYHLYLHPKTHQFVFMAGELEFALANFLLMGTADQLMDLSLTHPYAGNNKLVERLLAIPEVNAKYHKLLKDLSAKVFTTERLLKDIKAIETLTREPLAKEKRAAEARKEPPAGFGPPGGAAPQSPDLRAFAQKRTASVAAQLAGKSKGYIPPGFGFGQPGGGGGPGFGRPSQPTDEATFRDIVKVPDGFEATLFAAPPKVGYPVALAAAPTGELFVAVDEQGSIGRTPGGGKVLRCVDKDGDGKVDEVTVFAKMDHPRGLIYQDGRLWVLHPPFLSVYHDGGKGVADTSEVLVTGLTSDMIDRRGGDHTTNGIRMGLDGWIYIAVGDYGCPEAKGKDGSRITMRGGIARVRPDGTDLEIFARGLRNPFDIGIDPFMNLFTRDNNDNRAGGWDIRVSHLIQGACYGYSQHYANFPDEIMPPLGQFGVGSGTGTLFLEDERWPEKYRNVLLTGDWGRNEVYRHELRPSGPTFDLKQEVFLRLPRPTGMDMDASGRLYVASWRGGEASTYVGPNVGFIARITPPGLKPALLPNLKQANITELIRLLSSPNAAARLHSQREILRRGANAETTSALVKLVSDAGAPQHGRAAAIFTLKQLDGKKSHPVLLKLAGDAAVRELVLRALTDRKQELDGLDTKLFVAALADPSPRVRAQALISLTRLQDMSAARSIIPLTARPKGSIMPTKKPVHAQPDPDRVLPHLAVRALVALGAVDACLEALDGPYAHGALWALRSMHDKKTVDGLIRKLHTVQSSELRREVLATLIRLYHREADYKGVWWGITPENSGPYFDAIDWEQSKRIETVLTNAVRDADPSTAAFLLAELKRNRVSLKGLPNHPENHPAAEKDVTVVVQKSDPRNPNQIGNMALETVLKRTLEARGNAAKGKKLFQLQSCSACHTDSDGQTLKGPHLVGIGKRYSAAELAESILTPSAKIAQGYEAYLFEMANGKTYTGFIVSTSARSVRIREGTGAHHELQLDQIESQMIQKQSIMPEGLVNNLAPEELADLIAYLQSLTEVDDKPAPERRSEAKPTVEKPAAPVQLTAQEDHKRMMAFLGIKELRRGADGRNPKAPNAANYDESKANPYPKLPDPLVMKDGTRVTTAEMWLKKRRPEIIEDFDREVYGRVPKVTPSVKWEITDTKKEKIGEIVVVTKKLVGHVDNSSYPAITVDIQLTLTTPADAKGPVPVIMEFGFGGRGFGPPPGGRRGPNWQEQVLAKGWGYAIIVPNSIQADNGAGLTKGIIGLCNKGQPRKPEDWGALRAWAWGASRALDYFETDKAVDARKVGIEGLSRYGKAAIVAMAYDKRFAIGFIGSSGEGGVKLHRRNFGELVENVASTGEYHWMAGNFLKYAGPLTWDDLPVDAHELVALCAPRPVFISCGSFKVEGGWVDAKGMFLAGVAAGPVYRLLGKKDLGTKEMPAEGTALVEGEIAFRQHSGGHTTGPNWPTFLQLADRYFNSSPSSASKTKDVKK